MKKQKKIIRSNTHVRVFFMFFMLFGIICFASGWISKTNQIEKQMGISFECNQYISKSLNRNGCHANITIPSVNVTLQLTSNFDKLKVIQE